MTSFSRRDLVKGGAAMAGGVVLRARPVRAATKVRLLTNWFAEAEHGGFYQAAAAGLYYKAGLEVDIRQGNAQLNGMRPFARTTISLRPFGSPLTSISANSTPLRDNSRLAVWQ